MVDYDQIHCAASLVALQELCCKSRVGVCVCVFFFTCLLSITINPPNFNFQKLSFLCINWLLQHPISSSSSSSYISSYILPSVTGLNSHQSLHIKNLISNLTDLHECFFPINKSQTKPSQSQSQAKEIMHTVASSVTFHIDKNE